MVVRCPSAVIPKVRVLTHMAGAQNIKSILQECYANTEAVTEELVEYILKPGLEVSGMFLGR